MSWQPGRTLSEVERDTILAALRFYAGNRTHTARSLNISFNTLAAKIKKYQECGIEVTPTPKGAPQPKEVETV